MIASIVITALLLAGIYYSGYCHGRARSYEHIQELLEKQGKGGKS